MTLLEKPKQVRDVPFAPERRRFEWIMWVVLAFLIVAGIIAAIVLTTGTEGVPAEEINARLAMDNHIATARIAAIEHAPAHDLALSFTAFRVVEEQFPGRMEMLATSAARADQALGYTIARALGD